MTSNIEDYVLQTLTNLLRIHVVVRFSTASYSSTWQNWLKSFFKIFYFMLAWFFFWFLFLFLALTYTISAYDMWSDCMRK